MPTSANKRIAKNTLLLYARMILVMGVTLYTSRVVLRVLGIEDYGLYNVVAGIVTMLGFINTSAAGATSRFLTFSLGEKRTDKEQRYKVIFSTAFFIHLGIALAIVVLAETIGLWYVYNKLVIPEGRFNAAMWVYQISILNVLVSFTQVPYNASIIAHEKMGVFAFVGIYEAVSKLLAALLLSHLFIDKLILYAVLMFSITISISVFYRWYCIRHFKNTCRISFVKDKDTYKQMLSYSGWNVFSQFSYAARMQGVNLILNYFFGTAVNAARAIAYQVESAVYGFVSNFLQAVRPVIIKNYASREYAQTSHLIFLVAKFSLLLLSCMTIPIIIESDYVLHLWLGNPPEHSDSYLCIVLLNGLITCINQTLQIGIHASGDMKLQSLLNGGQLLLGIVVIFILMKFGYASEWAFWILLIGSVFALFVNLYVVKKNLPSFSVGKFFIQVLVGGGVLVIISSVGPFLIHIYWNGNDFLRLVSIVVSYIGILVLLTYVFGLNKSQRKAIINLIKKK